MMKREELETILKNHKQWLNHEGGERVNLQYADLRKADLRNADLRNADLQGADLQGADLRSANLRGANLQGADLQDANLRLADLQGADLQGADLSDANLRRANLQGANLQGADLRSADLDYSCLPLWCGSNGIIVDRRIAAQIAAHFCALECDDPDFLAAREAVLPFAQTSHRAEELGIKERE